jgi:8-oxo-dGTP pyrophosphatase MutT (NUDIX family)
MNDVNTPRQYEHWLQYQHARPSSAVVILEEGQHALIVKANYKAHWTFPGGMIDEGETPKQAAVREVQEEVGLSIDPDMLEFGWIITRHSQVADTYQFVFRAPLQASLLKQIVLQASEIDDWKWVSKHDILSGALSTSKMLTLWANDATPGYIEQLFQD